MELSNLAPKWVRLYLNRTNPGPFRSDFSTFWLVKSPGFVPFWPNLAHFGAKSDVTVYDVDNDVEI